MKKNLYIIINLIFLFSCNDKAIENRVSKEDSGKTDSTKTTIENSSSKNNLNTEKSIFNETFRNYTEFECFRGFKKNQAGVINSGNVHNRFAVQEIQNGNARILIFEEIIDIGEPSVNYKILDTLQLNNLKEDEYIEFGNCRKDSIVDEQIIVILELTGDESKSEYLNNIKSAWIANLKTRKLEKLIDLTGIDCENEGYGL